MMSTSGSFAVSRSDNGDRFCSYPNNNHRNNHNQVLQQRRLRRNNHNHQLQEVAVAVADAGDNRTDSDNCNATLSIPSLLSSSKISSRSRSGNNVTNLDSFLNSVTPVVPAQKSSENSLKGHEAEVHPYYRLGDLWETFREWSAYGAGVKFLLNGSNPTIQYYVPFLSGMQVYVDPQNSHSRLRCSGEESDGKSSSSSDDFVLDGLFGPKKLLNSNHQQLNGVSSRHGRLAYEYMEHEQPHARKPLADKVSALASQFPELNNYRSCDLLPSSWICVAWYPIYRIPMGPSLKDLDASFLTFHSLSTQPGSYGDAEFLKMSSRMVHGEVDRCSRVRLPVFGLASYKLKGSVISPCGPQECKQENALLEAATNWLHRLQALLPDYQFFLNRY